MQSLTVFDTTVRTDEHGRFCLNDLHKAAMGQGLASKSQRPANFLKSAPVKEFLAALEGDATEIASVYSVKGGKMQGTYATELVALRYAGWISPAAEVEVYRTFQKVRNADESLTADMIERQQDPNASRRLAARAQGKVARLEFTETLKDHGVEGIGFPNCTNALYRPLFGGTAKEIRAERSLPERANVRESMSTEELAATMFAEMVAIKRIRERQAHGNRQCYDQTFAAASETRAVLDGEGE